MILYCINEPDLTNSEGRYVPIIQTAFQSHILVETLYLPRIAVLLSYWHNLPLNDLELIYGQIRKPFLFFSGNLRSGYRRRSFCFLKKIARVIPAAAPPPPQYPYPYSIQRTKKEAAAADLVQLPVLIFMLILCINTIC